MNLDEINRIQAEQGFWAKFPPEGIQVLAAACEEVNLLAPDFVMTVGDLVQGYNSFESGEVAGAALLALPQPPTAIFAANDDMAAATCMEAQRRGLRIPDDISVVGFDDAPIAGVIWPTLTTIRQPLEQMALRALQTFNAWNANEGAVKSTAPFLAQHSLVIRESTGPARTGPPTRSKS